MWRKGTRLTTLSSSKTANGGRLPLTSHLGKLQAKPTLSKTLLKRAWRQPTGTVKQSPNWLMWLWSSHSVTGKTSKTKNKLGFLAWKQTTRSCGKVQSSQFRRTLKTSRLITPRRKLKSLAKRKFWKSIEHACSVQETWIKSYTNSNWRVSATHSRRCRIEISFTRLKICFKRRQALLLSVSVWSKTSSLSTISSLIWHKENSTTCRYPLLVS